MKFVSHKYLIFTVYLETDELILFNNENYSVYYDIVVKDSVKDI